jgi:hypothetical protein
MVVIDIGEHLNNGFFSKVDVEAALLEVSLDPIDHCFKRSLIT